MTSNHARSSWRRVPLPPASGILYPWSFEISCSQFVYGNSTMHPELNLEKKIPLALLIPFPSESWHASHHDSLHCHQWRPSVVVRTYNTRKAHNHGWKRCVPVMMRIGPLTSHFYTRCFILLPTLVVLQFTWREDLFQLAIAIWKSLCCMFITSIVEEIDPPPPQQERVDDMAFAYSCGEICPSLHCVILEVLLIYITCACSITWWRTLRVAKQGRLAGRLSSSQLPSTKVYLDNYSQGFCICWIYKRYFLLWMGDYAMFEYREWIWLDFTTIGMALQDHIQ